MAEKQKNRRKNDSLKAHADKTGEHKPDAKQIINLVENVKEQTQNSARCRAGRNVNLALQKAVRQFAEHRCRTD